MGEKRLTSRSYYVHQCAVVRLMHHSVARRVAEEHVARRLVHRYACHHQTVVPHIVLLTRPGAHEGQRAEAQQGDEHKRETERLQRARSVVVKDGRPDEWRVW